MFKKIASIFSSKAVGPAPAPDPSLAAAFEKGREIGAVYSDQASAYIDGRMAHIEQAFLTVLQKRLDTARYQEEHSPVLVARVEYDLFVENVENSALKLVEETKAALSEWDSFHAEIGVSDDIDRLAAALVQAKTDNLKELGLNVVLANAEILKVADAQWRVRFPERAAAERDEASAS